MRDDKVLLEGMHLFIGECNFWNRENIKSKPSPVDFVKRTPGFLRSASMGKKRRTIRINNTTIRISGVRIVGDENEITGDDIVVVGNNNRLKGNRCRLEGDENEAIGEDNYMEGNNCSAHGRRSVAIGDECETTCSDGESSEYRYSPSSSSSESSESSESSSSEDEGWERTANFSEDTKGHREGHGANSPGFFGVLFSACAHFLSSLAFGEPLSVSHMDDRVEIIYGDHKLTITGLPEHLRGINVVTSGTVVLGGVRVRGRKIYFEGKEVDFRSKGSEISWEFITGSSRGSEEKIKRKNRDKELDAEGPPRKRPRSDGSQYSDYLGCLPEPSAPPMEEQEQEQEQEQGTPESGAGLYPDLSGYPK